MSDARKTIRQTEALRYHAEGRPGKLEIVPTKPFATQRDLSLAYSPGVAEPCLEIAKNPDDVFKYTGRGNLVAVISNGTAVLGLGDIGPLASKPVMEGKAILFKRFADIDVFDIEIGETDPDKFIAAVKALEPTFGGINLEDVKAPECFYIEEQLRKQMRIPLMHDDQHGTAIIATAGLKNALLITKKDISKLRVVFNGAGAAGIACLNLFVEAGVRTENVILCDTKGVVFKGRTAGMNPLKQRYASDTAARTLDEAMVGADVFVGVSVANVVTPEMLQSMAKDPVVFALANPVPEIGYNEARAARPDVIMATGRSDYPNQINNVLGFPYIFRGALDVRAREINEAMKLAAVDAIATLAREEVPSAVRMAYGGQEFTFGRDYLIPKPFDERVLYYVAPAVAKAAVDSGVAQVPITDFSAYRTSLKKRLHPVLGVRERIRRDPAAAGSRRIVFPEGTDREVIRAAHILADDGYCAPILIGDPVRIAAIQRAEGLVADQVRVFDPAGGAERDAMTRYSEEFWRLRQRKGVRRDAVRQMLGDTNRIGALMVRLGDADGLVTGKTKPMSTTLRPIIRIVKPRAGVTRVAGAHIAVLRDRWLFFADTTVNNHPGKDALVEIASLTVELARDLQEEPRVAFLSYSNFGSVDQDDSPKVVAEAAARFRELHPGIASDGEMAADTALNPRRAAAFPFSTIQGDANILVFPDIGSANIGFKLVRELAHGASVVGPILLGMAKPVNVVDQGATADEIVTVATITASAIDNQPG